MVKMYAVVIMIIPLVERPVSSEMPRISRRLPNDKPIKHRGNSRPSTRDRWNSKKLFEIFWLGPWWAKRFPCSKWATGNWQPRALAFGGNIVQFLFGNWQVKALIAGLVWDAEEPRASRPRGGQKNQVKSGNLTRYEKITIVSFTAVRGSKLFETLWGSRIASDLIDFPLTTKTMVEAKQDRYSDGARRCDTIIQSTIDQMSLILKLEINK